MSLKALSVDGSILTQMLQQGTMYSRLVCPKKLWDTEREHTNFAASQSPCRPGSS